MAKKTAGKKASKPAKQSDAKDKTVKAYIGGLKKGMKIKVYKDVMS